MHMRFASGNLNRFEPSCFLLGVRGGAQPARRWWCGRWWCGRWWWRWHGFRLGSDQGPQKLIFKLGLPSLLTSIAFHMNHMPENTNLQTSHNGYRGCIVFHTLPAIFVMFLKASPFNPMEVFISCSSVLSCSCWRKEVGFQNLKLCFKF